MEVDKTKGDNLIDEINMLIVGGDQEDRTILLTSPHTVYQLNNTLQDKVIQIFSSYFSEMSDNGVLVDDLYVDLERIDKILKKEMLTNIVHFIIDSSLTEILYRVRYGQYGHFFSHLLYKGGEENHDILYRAVVSQESTKNITRVIDALMNVTSPDRKFIDKVLTWKIKGEDTYMDLLIRQKNFVSIRYIDQVVSEIPYVSGGIYNGIVNQNFNDYEDFLYKFYTTTGIGWSHLINSSNPGLSHIFVIAYLCTFSLIRKDIREKTNSITSALSFVKRIETFLGVNFLDVKIPKFFADKPNPLRSLIEILIINANNHNVTSDMRRTIYSFKSTEAENSTSTKMDPESELRVLINIMNNKKLSHNDYSQLAMAIDDYADSFMTKISKTSTRDFVYYLKSYYGITSTQATDMMKDSLKMIDQIMTKIVSILSINELTKFLTDLYGFILILEFPELNTIMKNVHENPDLSKATLSVLGKFIKK